jgi:class III poly(R)-hydroxyalkanoic acid synthase PhaE subunit
MRESHDEHQSLVRAWVELQKAQQAYHELFAGLPSQVCEEIGQRLDTLASEGKVVDSLRGFYDLVVDAAEVRYAVLTNSEAHSERYGRAVNALMSFRGQLLKLADQFQGALNLPTRKELDELHREARIQSRQNRSLHAEVAEIRSLLAAMDRGNSKPGDAKRASTPEDPSLAARPPARTRRKNISRETK